MAREQVQASGIRYTVRSFLSDIQIFNNDVRRNVKVIPPFEYQSLRKESSVSGVPVLILVAGKMKQSAPIRRVLWRVEVFYKGESNILARIYCP